MKSINQIRRERLRGLVDKFDGGKTAALTERMRWKSPSLATRYLTESPKNNKPIGDNLAREIESAYGVEPNYLDNLPKGDSMALDAIETQLVFVFRQLSQDSKDRLLGRLHAMYLEEHPKAREEFGPTVFESDVEERQSGPRRRQSAKS